MFYKQIRLQDSLNPGISGQKAKAAKEYFLMIKSTIYDGN
jgi:hypothetical protein